MSGNNTNSDTDSGVSRRTFVKTAGATGVVASFAGCGGGNGNGNGGNGNGGNGNGGNGNGGNGNGTGNGDGELVVQWAAGQQPAQNSEAINSKLTELGLSENISLDILGGSNITDQRQSRYNQWLNAERPEPTILMADSGWTIPFIARNQFQSLEDMEAYPQSLIDRINDEYFQASVQTAKSPDGVLHGQPLFPDFPTMQYRKDVLREAGYSDSDFDTWTTDPPKWAEFSQITDQAIPELESMMSDSDQSIYGYTFQANAYEGLSCCDFNEFMTSWGGAYFGDPSQNLFANIGDRPITVEEEQVLDSIRMVRTFIHGSDASNTLSSGDYAGGIAPEAVLQWQEEPSRQPFTNGGAVMHRNWPYSININGAEGEFGEDLGVMPIPYAAEPGESYPMTGGPVAALGGWHLAVNPHAPQERKDAAAEVMEVMAQDEFQLWLFEQIGWLPPKSELFTSEAATEVPIMGRYMDSLRVAGENAIPRPVTVLWPQQSERISNQVNAAYAGDASPEDAMSTLADKLEQLENNA